MGKSHGFHSPGLITELAVERDHTLWRGSKSLGAETQQGFMWPRVQPWKLMAGGQTVGRLCSVPAQRPSVRVLREMERGEGRC
jgi:hypothetical protein